MRLALLGGFAIGLLLAVGAVVLLSRSDEPTEGQGGEARARWYNVTYPTIVAATIDGKEQTFLVYARVDPNQPQNVTLNVDYPKGDSGVVIDGATAAILSRGSPVDATISGLADSLVAGIEFSKFSPNRAPWPYRPDVGKDVPDPLSGITTSALTTQGRTGTLYVNFRSRLIIWEESPEGTVEYSCQTIDPADVAAFARLVSARTAPGVSPVAVSYPRGVESCVFDAASP